MLQDEKIKGIYCYVWKIQRHALSFGLCRTERNKKQMKITQQNIRKCNRSWTHNLR